MAVSRGKMLGHYSPGSGGYKCWCCTTSRMTRDAKRREAREVAEEIAAEAAMWREQPDLMREIAAHVSGEEPLKLVPADVDDLR